MKEKNTTNMNQNILNKQLKQRTLKLKNLNTT